MELTGNQRRRTVGDMDDGFNDTEVEFITMYQRGHTDGYTRFVVCDGVHANMLCGDADADGKFIAAMPLYFKRLFKEVLALREELDQARGIKTRT